MSEFQEYVFFWKPQDENGYLSQWYSSPFIMLNGTRFATVEQYMMYHKAIHFDDIETANLIKSTPHSSPGFHKRLGKNVQGFDDVSWNIVKRDIVVRGNMYKFAQNSELLQQLLSTDKSVLAEASPYDRVWGIGYDRDHGIDNINLWGENMLGSVLMEVRDKLSNKSTVDRFKHVTHVDFAD